MLPTVATMTFSPDFTLSAPHTICKTSVPMSTCVTFKRSASSCLTQSVTFPITRPSNPPGILSILLTPSTSKPVSVNTFASSVTDKSKSM